jgi:hypothetical protein
VQDTWIKYIENGHFATRPSLKADNVRKYLPKYVNNMVKEYTNKIRKNIRSSQPKVVAPTPEPGMEQEEKCDYVYVTIMETGQIYTDLPVIFPTTYLNEKNTYWLYMATTATMSSPRL